MVEDVVRLLRLLPPLLVAKDLKKEEISTSEAIDFILFLKKVWQNPHQVNPRVKRLRDPFAVQGGAERGDEPGNDGNCNLRKVSFIFFDFFTAKIFGNKNAIKVTFFGSKPFDSLTKINGL